MAISTTVLSPAVALTRDLPRTPPSPLAGLLLAAAGMAQRWRSQTRQSVQLLRAARAQKLARAKRRERDRLPPASRRRSAAHFEALAMDSAALALRAASAGHADMAAEHVAEARWFTTQAVEILRWEISE